jgi:hypothetical protein
VGFSDFEAPKIVESQAPFLGTAEHLPKIVRRKPDRYSYYVARHVQLISAASIGHGSKDPFPGNLKRTSLSVVKMKNEVISFSALKKLRK